MHFYNRTCPTKYVLTQCTAAACSCSEEITGKKEKNMYTFLYFFYFLGKKFAYNNTTESRTVNKAVLAPLYLRKVPNYKSHIQYGIVLEYCPYLILALTCGG